jgi:putative protein kinase ArgK-like GTPase of G3E family
VLQFVKAGVMEIPDLLVVNKADHGATAARAASDLKSALSTLRQVGAGEGDQQVILTSARDPQSVDKLADAIAQHRQQLGAAGVAERRPWATSPGRSTGWYAAWARSASTHSAAWRRSASNSKAESPRSPPPGPGRSARAPPTLATRGLASRRTS